MAFASEIFGKKWFRRGIMAILAFLLLQFILGMTLNLFVAFPGIPAGSSDQTYINAIFTTPFLLGHFIIGVGLLFGSIWILIGAILTKVRNISIVAAIGLISILAAYVSGFGFLLSGFQDNTLSFTMSLGFIVALVSYFSLFHMSGRLNDSRRTRRSK
ncbi:MAG: hypothetical protein KGH98_02220 [Candidatus Micrarchaeota archaeon]|nr:hypothetical protein [Candidatus Micrarchaeota archaeon]